MSFRQPVVAYVFEQNKRKTHVASDKTQSGAALVSTNPDQKKGKKKLPTVPWEVYPIISRPTPRELIITRKEKPLYLSLTHADGAG